MKRSIYLDNNATTLLDPKVAEVFFDASLRLSGNPSSVHAPGRAAKAALIAARRAIAAVLGVLPEEIIFTSGATEALNWLCLAFSRGGLVVSSDLEHPAVYKTLQQTRVHFVSPGHFGAVTPDLIAPHDPAALVLMAANNETGALSDIEGLGTFASAKGIPLVVDGVALLGKECFTIPKGVTAMCFSGHKFHAPKGVGFCFLRKGIKIPPMTHGGGQEGGRRSGTENVPAIIALAKAVELAHNNKDQIERMRRLTAEFSKIPNALINATAPLVSNTINIAFPGFDGEALLAALDQAGVFCSAGSACSSGALEPSRVLLNMGYPVDRAACSLRLSVSRFTTHEEVLEAKALIQEAIFQQVRVLNA